MQHIKGDVSWQWYWPIPGSRKLREKISVTKQARQKFDVERFDLKKLDDVEVQEKYQVEISNRFAGLESLDESFDINNAWAKS
jgi:hypothetical protein